MNKSPWKQCRWCPKKFMGYRNLSNHVTAVHLPEGQRAKLVEAVKYAQDSLTYEQEERADHAEYTAFLEQVSIYPRVRLIVQRQLTRFASLYRYQDPLSVWEDRVSAAVKALEEWDAAHKEVSDAQTTASH